MQGELRTKGLGNAMRLVQQEEQQRKANDTAQDRVVGSARAEEGAGHDGGTRYEGAQRGGGQVKEQTEQGGVHGNRSKESGGYRSGQAMVFQGSEWHVRAGQGRACINSVGNGRYGTAQQEQGQIQRRTGQ